MWSLDNGYDYVSISVSTSKFTISPTINNSPGVGSYQVSFYGMYAIQGTQSCSNPTDDYSFNVIIVNGLSYVSLPQNQSTYVGTQIEYQMPALTNPAPSASLVFIQSLTSLIAWNNTSTTFKINPTDQSNVGSYLISFNLSDGQNLAPYSFTVKVLNNPPTWNGSISSMTVPLNRFQTQLLPAVQDLDTGSSLSITFTQDSSPQVSITTSVDSNGRTILTVSPANQDEIGLHQLTFSVTDGYDSTSQSFTITVTNVTNSPPYFNSSIQTNLTAYLNQVSTYILPSMIDDEGQAITVSFLLPPFVTYQSNTLTFSPSQESLLNSISTGNLTLTDSAGASNTYEFTVSVPNRAPYFPDNRTSFTSVQVALNSVFNVTIPSFFDPDLTTPNITFNKTTSPQLTATLIGTTILQISPTSFNEVGIHETQIQLADSIVTTYFSLQITVTNTAPYFQTPKLPLPSLTVPFNFKTSIPFGYADLEGNSINVTIYETFKGNKTAIPTKNTYLTSPGMIIFYPTQFSEIGTHTIEVNISDGQPLSTVEQFTIEVTNNNPPFFVDQLPFSVNMKFNNTYEYILPQTADKENNTISYYLISNPSIDHFTTFQSDSFSLKPNLWSHLGTYKLTLILSDLQANSTAYNFTLTITNSAPKLQGSKLRDQKVRLGSHSKLAIDCVDENYNPIFIKLIMTHPFVSLEGFALSLNPKTPKHLGLFKIRFSLSDQQLSSTYDFIVEVFNEAPYFLENLQDQYVLVGQQLIYNLPKAEDAEFLPIKMSVNSISQNGGGGGPLVSFMKLVEKTIIIRPTSSKNKGRHQIEVSLEDGYASPKKYQFSVTVDDDSKQLKNNNIEKSGLQVSKALIKLKQVSKEGKLQMRILSSSLWSNLTKSFKNDSIKINLIAKDQTTEVNFTIESRNEDQGKVDMKLLFLDPTKVSQGTELDRIQVIFLKDLQSKSKFNIVYIPGQTISETTVLPQFSGVQASIAKNFNGGITLFDDQKLYGIFLNMGVSWIIQWLWGQMSDMSFLTILSLVSISAPGLAKVIQGALLGFISMDLLYTDRWVIPLIFKDENQISSSGNEDEVINDNEALNPFFEENGFPTKFVIKNLGSTFVYLILFIFILLLLPVLKFLGKHSEIALRLYQWMIKKLLWNGILQFIMSQYPAIIIAAVINLYGLDFKKMGGIMMSNIASIVLLSACLISIPVIWCIIKKGMSNGAERDNFDLKFGSLIENQRAYASAIAAYWQLLTLIRWTITTIILIFAKDFCQAQIFLLQFVSMVYQVLLIRGKPFENSFNNKMSLFTELLVSAYLYLLLWLEQLTGEEEQQRELVGLMLISVIAFSVLANVLIFAKTAFFKCLNYILKQERAQIYSANQEKKRLDDVSDTKNITLRQDQITIQIDNDQQKEVEAKQQHYHEPQQQQYMHNHDILQCYNFGGDQIQKAPQVEEFKREYHLPQIKTFSSINEYNQNFKSQQENSYIMGPVAKYKPFQFKSSKCDQRFSVHEDSLFQKKLEHNNHASQYRGKEENKDSYAYQ